MSNTISPSFYTRSITWLTEQTSPSKTNDTNSSAAVKWIAKRTKATNIALGSGILFGGSWILDYFTKDSDNRILNYFTKGLKWISGIATIAFPFANLGSKKDDMFLFSKPFFSPDDPGLKNKFLKSFVEDPNVPLYDYTKTSLLPGETSPKDYREKIYKVVLELTKDKQDPLFLSTPLDSVPANFKARVSNLRTSLLKAYGDEIARKNENPKLYCEEVVKTIELILDSAKEIPRCEWNEEAKKQKGLEEQNNFRYLEFKKWGGNITRSPITEIELRTVFNQFSELEKESLDKCKKILEASGTEYGDLKKDISEVLEMINSTLERVNCNPDSLGCSIYKIPFFISYLSKLVHKEILAGGPHNIWYLIDEKISNQLIDNLRRIVCSKVISPEVKRDLNFFLLPDETSVPGKALCLLRKILPTKLPANDEFDDCSKVLQVAHECLYNNDYRTGSKVILISGNPDVSNHIGRYTSRKLCVPIIELEDFNITKRDNGVCIRHNSNETPINEYFRTHTNLGPKIILLKYFDCMVNADAKYDGIGVQRAALFEQLKEINKSDSPVVVIIGIDGVLDYEKLGNASFDSSGYSSEVDVALKESLDSSFTLFNIHPICFHGLQKKNIEKYKEQELEKRERSIETLIMILKEEESKTVDSTLNYREITLASQDLSLPQIAKAIRALTPKSLTQDNILIAFGMARNK